MIDTAPTALTNATTATLTFHSTSSGATFACSLDGAAATPAPARPATPGSPKGRTPSAWLRLRTGRPTRPRRPTPGRLTPRRPRPRGLTATAAAPTTVNLSWSASTDSNGVTGYDIVRNGTTIGTVPGTSTSYVDASASPGTSYTYTVDAKDGAGKRLPAERTSHRDHTVGDGQPGPRAGCGLDHRYGHSAQAKHAGRPAGAVGQRLHRRHQPHHLGH